MGKAETVEMGRVTLQAVAPGWARVLWDGEPVADIRTTEGEPGCTMTFLRKRAGRERTVPKKYGSVKSAVFFVVTHKLHLEKRRSAKPPKPKQGSLKPPPEPNPPEPNPPEPSKVPQNPLSIRSVLDRSLPLRTPLLVYGEAPVRVSSGEAGRTFSDISHTSLNPLPVSLEAPLGEGTVLKHLP